MKPRFLVLLYTISFSLFFANCSKESEDACAGKPAPVISAPQSVSAGSDLTLDVASIPYARYYQWSGPNGFTSSDQSPVIKRAQASAAGKYTVYVGFDEGCVKTATTDSIIVTLPSAPCAPVQNTASMSGAGTLTFSSVTPMVSGGSFFIRASGLQGDLEIEFPGTERPVAGVYSVQPLGGEWLAGNVRVRLVAQSSNWPASSGSLYVRVINNKITATFCSLPVFNQTFSFPSTASGSVTEK
jgi:hypothetical protein